MKGFCFGKDSIIALATLDGDVPWVRSVNGFYENGAFYVITYALSNKMQQIERIPTWQSQTIGLQHIRKVSILVTLVKMRAKLLQKNCGKHLRRGLKMATIISMMKIPVFCAFS